MFDALVILSVFAALLITALALVGAYKLLPRKAQNKIMEIIGGEWNENNVN